MLEEYKVLENCWGLVGKEGIVVVGVNYGCLESGQGGKSSGWVGRRMGSKVALDCKTTCCKQVDHGR